ncbi:unnamed protein product [Boreogadus saida]
MTSSDDTCWVSCRHSTPNRCRDSRRNSPIVSTPVGTAWSVEDRPATVAGCYPGPRVTVDPQNTVFLNPSNPRTTSVALQWYEQQLWWGLVIKGITAALRSAVLRPMTSTAARENQGEPGRNVPSKGRWRRWGWRRSSCGGGVEVEEEVAVEEIVLVEEEVVLEEEEEAMEEE